MASKLLSDRKVATVTLDEGVKEKLLNDGDGLFLRVRDTGESKLSRTWLLVYSGPSSKRRKITLGSADDHSLKEARAWASDQRKQIDLGEDPLQQRRKAGLDALDREKQTFGGLLNAYVDHLKKTGKTSYRDAESVFRLHISDRLKQSAAADVTKYDLVKAIRKVIEAGKGRTATILRSYLHAAFQSTINAEDNPRLSSDLLGFGLEINPVAKIDAMTKFNNTGERALKRSELQEYFKRLQALDSGITKDILLLSLYLGGQRITQLLKAEIGSGAGGETVLIIRDKKGRRSKPRIHLLPLMGEALKIVNSRGKSLFNLKTDDDVQDELLRASGKVRLISKYMNKDEISETAFNLRDIRRTAETHLAAAGVSKDIRAQLQSHGLSGVQDKHYDKHEYMVEKANVLRAWEAYLLETPANNVIEIRKNKG